MADITGFTDEVLLEPLPLLGGEGAPLFDPIPPLDLDPVPLAGIPEGFTEEIDAPAGFTEAVAPLDLVPTPDGPALTPKGFTQTVEPSDEQDEVIAKTSVGRVMDAFSQGFGNTDLGLSEESEKAFRKGGIFKDLGDASFQPLRAFNQALIRPLAVGIDTIIRTANGAIYGIAATFGTLADETGLADLVGLPGSKLERDIIGLIDVVGIVSGVAPARFRVPRDRLDLAKADSAPTKATKPFKDAERTTPDTNIPPIERTERAGNINLKKIEDGEDVKDVIRAAANVSDDFIEQRRGVVSHRQTGELADALGMTPQELAKTKVGTAFNAHEIDAAVDLMVNSAADVRNLVIAADKGSDAAMLNLVEGVTRHLAIQESVAGVTAEAGRALNILKKQRKSTLDAEVIENLLAGTRGRQGVQEMIDHLKHLNTTKQITGYLKNRAKATFGDMVVEVWINWLLSGPQTHIVNIMSNTITATILAPTEALVGAALSTARRAKGVDKIFWGEASQRLYGFAQGGLEGIRTGWKAFRTEEFSSIHTKVEQPRQKAIPSATIKIGERKFEVGGKQFRIPGRALTAMDELFKSIGYRSEMNAQAYRIAATEGLKGEARAARIAELVENPTAAMQKAATETAAYQTFTKPLGETGQFVQKISNSHPLLKIPFTFVRTPTNILKYAGERTILSGFSKKVRGKIFKEAKFFKKGSLTFAPASVAQSEQMARIIVGSAIAGGAYTLAVNGFITGGGPSNTRERAVKYASGWQPYSIRIGEMNYSFARGEPIGTIVGIVADLYEIREHATDTEITDLTALITAAIAKNVLSKTWTKGLSDLVEAVSDPDRYGENYIRKLAGTVIPTGLAQAARAQDPVLREARTVLDVIKSRIPGLSQTLLPRYDVFGQPIVLEGSAGPDFLSPIYESRIKDDPVVRELLELKIFPAKLQRKIRGAELSDKQYAELQIMAGTTMKQILDRAVATPNWGKQLPFARSEYIKKVVEKTRDNARMMMLMRHPDLFKAALNHQRKQMGLAPIE
jgi:hypothetical protein